MKRHNRMFWSILVVLILVFCGGIFWQKSAYANHSCAGVTGPFGGRRINCTYYANLAIHPGFEVYNAGSWNWPFGYQGEGLIPNNAYNNSDSFISYVQNFLFRCGVHPVNENGCDGPTPASRHARWGVTVGHSFIVNTMLGVPGSRFEPGQAAPYNTFMYGGVWYAQDNFNTWANRVREYEAAGLITWNQFLTHGQVANIPGGQCGGAGGRSDTVVIDMGGFGMDQGIYNNTFCEDANYIVFRHPTTNQAIYRINRRCGNVTGDMSALPPVSPHGFNATPTANVTTAPDNETPATATFTSGVSYTGAPFTGQLAWNYFVQRSGSAVQQSLATGNVTQTFTGSSFNQSPVTINVAGLNLRVGDRLCNRTRITPGAGQAAPNGVVTVITVPTVVTPDVCVTITSRPYHKVYGGDVLAGAAFGAPCLDPNAGIIGWSRDNFLGFGLGVGSGGQLAVSALNTITEFTSGQVRNNLNPGANSVSNVTFANTGGGFGGNLDQANAVCAADFWAGYGGGAVPAIINAGHNGDFSATGPLTLQVAAGGIGVGQRVTVYVEGDVYIASDINYQVTAYNSLQEIPSFRLIVRGGNIYVAPGVRILNGTFVAIPTNATNGRFYTCSNGFGAPTLAQLNAASGPTSCLNRLTVYGSIIADLIKFTRSGGTLNNSSPADRYNAPGNPAELIINSPESWLTSGFNSGGDYNAITTLPPVL